MIDNELYKFGDKKNKIRKFALIDNEVLFCRADLGFLYNYKEKKIISSDEQGYVDYKKVDSFFYYQLFFCSFVFFLVVLVTKIFMFKIFKLLFVKFFAVLILFIF